MSKLGATGISVISGAAFLIAWVSALLLLSPCQLQKVTNFFQEHLREPLFAGLLTVAAFLFSLKTFIIVTMHEKVYATEEYGVQWEKLRVLNMSLRRYAPLENFALLLFLSVLISLLSSVVQFTIGLVDAPWAAIFSIAVGAWAIAMIFVALFFLQSNLQSWFKFLNDRPPSPPTT